MCVGIPARVVQLVDLEDHIALVDVGGVQRRVDVSLVLPDGLAVGHWVLVHVGFAMAKIDEAEAKETLDQLKALGDLYEQELSDYAAPVEGLVPEQAGAGGHA